MPIPTEKTTKMKTGGKKYSGLICFELGNWINTAIVAPQNK